jgi:AcrR family transcriptional regulator
MSTQPTHRPTPRGTAREHLLDVASELFYQEGIRAVGIDTIIAKSSVAKMTFYKHFKSKDDLVLEYIRRRDKNWREWFEAAVERYARTPQERPLAIFDALEERFSTPDYRGCAFINTMVEMANRNHIASQAAAEHKQSVQQFVTQILQDAGYENAVLLGQQFILLIDGAIVTALREGTAASAYAARQIAVQLLKP